jgi:hypothetical protein
MRTENSISVSMRVHPDWVKAVDDEVHARRINGAKGYAISRSNVIASIVAKALGVSLKPVSKSGEQL